jgi:hypothetical protein
MRKKQLQLQQQHSSSSSLEQVMYEEARQLARGRNWSVSFALSIIWSNFKSAGDVENTEVVFVLVQREEQRKGKQLPIFIEGEKG